MTLSILGLRRLSVQIDSLPFTLDRDVFVAGGAVVRALVDCPGGDLDVWAPPQRIPGIQMALGDAGWYRGEDSGSNEGRDVWWRAGRVQIDLITYHQAHPDHVLEGFDWGCSRVATDGRDMWAADGALEDVEARLLICHRRVTLERLNKYQAMGFRLPKHIPAHEMVLPGGASFEQRFGIDPVAVGS